MDARGWSQVGFLGTPIWPTSYILLSISSGGNPKPSNPVIQSPAGFPSSPGLGMTLSQGALKMELGCQENPVPKWNNSIQMFVRYLWSYLNSTFDIEIHALARDKAVHLDLTTMHGKCSWLTDDAEAPKWEWSFANLEGESESQRKALQCSQCPGFQWPVCNYFVTDTAFWDLSSRTHKYQVSFFLLTEYCQPCCWVRRESLQENSIMSLK